MINLLDLLSRLLISIIFLYSGISKVFQYQGTVQWMESFGISGIFLTPTIICEIIFPILIIIGYRVRLSASVLAIFCISTAFIFHSDFNNQVQLIAFFKNLALSGGLLFLAINGPKNFILFKKKKYVQL